MSFAINALDVTQEVKIFMFIETPRLLQKLYIGLI